MPDPDLPSLRLPDPDRRDRVIQQLSDHFAAGRLELEELERRMDLAVRVQTLGELDALVDDLENRAVAVPAVVAKVPVRRAAAGSRGTLAFMDGTARKGVWKVAPRHRALAWWGGAELDFRQAELTADVTVVRAVAIMGGISIIVPPDLEVEVSGTGLLGGIANRTKGPAKPGARTLIIRGFALMGAVEVKTGRTGSRES
jgi:hypothetical protein